LSWTAPSPEVFRELAGQTHVWRLDLSRLSPWQDYQDRLTLQERERAGHILLASAALQFVGTRACLRDLLSRYLQTSPLEICLIEGPKGKPRLAPDAERSLWFNVAHSGEVALLVFSLEGSVGVDVERLDANRRMIELAERYFHPSEAARLRGAPEAERLRLFYRMWTLKEALLKAWGEGLSFSLKDIELSRDLQSPQLCCHRETVPPQLAQTVLTALPDPAPSYAAALARLVDSSEPRLFVAQL